MIQSGSCEASEFTIDWSSGSLYFYVVPTSSGLQIAMFEDVQGYSRQCPNIYIGAVTVTDGEITILQNEIGRCVIIPDSYRNDPFSLFGWYDLTVTPHVLHYTINGGKVHWSYGVLDVTGMSGIASSYNDRIFYVECGTNAEEALDSAEMKNTNYDSTYGFHIPLCKFNSSMSQCTIYHEGILTIGTAYSPSEP